MGRIVMVTGAARSGKSEWAERLVRESGKAVIYVATAQRYEGDTEWDARIEVHIQRRPSGWRSMEVPIELSSAIAGGTGREILLVDSLGSWVGNLLEESEEDWLLRCETLVQQVRECAVDIVFVAEETGWGVVPAYPIGRLFRDRLGRLVRLMGQVSGETFLVVAGFAVDLRVVGQAIDR
jgi:adenosylcobinamide kinase / adenosylcobinamide-phosphate guanylyltransferase